MLHPVRRVLDGLNFLSSTPPEPTIGTHPTLWLPQCFNLDLDEEFEGECTTILSEKDFHLHFSVDFHHSSYNDISDIVNNFELKRTKIILERFIRKISNAEKYDVEKHAPTKICLPSNDEILHGFSFSWGISCVNQIEERSKKGF